MGGRSSDTIAFKEPGREPAAHLSIGRRNQVEKDKVSKTSEKAILKKKGWLKTHSLLT